MSEKRILCGSEEETKSLAADFASKLKAGDVIELIGDVGSGKTFFTRAIADSLGAKNQVTSPTFVIKNIYDGKFKIFHYDLYRLSEPGNIKDEIAEDLSRPESIVIVEWAESSYEILPKNRYKIKFISDVENSREIIMEKTE